MIKRNPKDTHVAVLMGGWSAEREVSLSSGEGCAAALRRAGFNVTPIDAQRETIFFPSCRTCGPMWRSTPSTGNGARTRLSSALLETLQIPYTHSGVLASSLAMNKEKSKHLFHEAGIPVAESLLVEIEVAATQHPMALPYVLKPVDEGSSVGVHIVTEQSNGPAAIILEQRNLFGSHVMAERFIPGRELTCAVMGDVALGVIDIISKVGFYDYRAKYSPGGSQHILPADIPKDVYRKCQQYSLQAHRALGCRGVSRADFRYDDTQGPAGELILLEINTQPGMTGTSLVPELAAHSGHSYEELVTWMVNDASINR